MENYDFGGWATRNDLQCSDGVIIRKDAFKGNDGVEVPLIWNHDHTTPEAVLGHAVLENRDDGVYAYGKFNDTEAGQNAKKLVENGDIRSLSIWANSLKKVGRDVVHGKIRELSLVLAGANPGAYVDFVMAHSDDGDEEFVANYDECGLVIYHSSEKKEEVKEEKEEEIKEKKTEEDKEMAEETKKTEGEKTVADVFNEFTEEQKTVVYAMIGQALEDAAKGDDDEDEDDVKHNDEGGNVMKYNAFETEENVQNGGVISHADQAAIIELAKDSTVGSFKKALEIYAANHGDFLSHGIDEIDKLFPDYKDVHPGAPELIERDQRWVQTVLKKAHKSPVSRVRTRQADARAAELRAKGYNNREEQKALSGNLKLLMRTFDPQTVYRRDELHRDDIVDIDFDVVAYMKTVMKHNMEEEIALAALVGDGREDTDADKIHEDHIRSVWHDDDLYTIHTDVDIEAAKAELQGTETGAHFGENYIYAEAVITAALYSREKYKGKGQLDFYCTPHLLNVMLLARDLNGRRIYDTKEDLAKALNVGEIHEVEQFEGLTRTTEEGDVKKLLGLFVNMANYQFGSTKGGELTSFDDFDIDFNKYKYLMETRLSGALTEIYSAIALEEPVSSSTGV